MVPAIPYSQESFDLAADFPSAPLECDLGLGAFAVPPHVGTVTFYDFDIPDWRASFEERDAKRARAEALREELRQLEAEL